MHSTAVSDSRGAQARGESGPGMGIYVAFVPWVLFSLITQHSTLKLASVAAFAASCAIAFVSVSRAVRSCWRSVRPWRSRGSRSWRSRPILRSAPGSAAMRVRFAGAGLAVIAFGSLPFVPFTEQYARESVPRQFWSSPRFHAVNRQLTAMWGLVFVLMVPAHIVAGAIDTHQANLIFNWGIPAMLIMWAAKRTAAVWDAAGEAS